MKRIQVYNLYIFVGIMVLDNDLIGTSPSYFKEKCKNILNIDGGKDVFITTPPDWDKYCNIWHVKGECYSLMNMLNFLLLLQSNYKQYKSLSPKVIIENYKFYIGNVNKIPESGYIRYYAHDLIKRFVDEFVDSIYMTKELVEYLDTHNQNWHSKI